MSILTLTTDSGLKDPYVPAVKGYLYGRVPGLMVADITHEIAPFSLMEAAYILEGCWREFPPGTVHLISIDSEEKRSRVLLARAGGQYFIIHDNGLLTLFLPEVSIEEVIALPSTPEDHVFPLRKIMAPAAAALLNGADMAALGVPAPDFLRRTHFAPMVSRDVIQGSVIYVDRSGNCITNITEEHLRQFGLHRRMVVVLRRDEYFTRLSPNYNDVDEGEKLALLNTAGRLEIAINKGNASKLLGLRQDSRVMVEFDGN